MALDSLHTVRAAARNVTAGDGKRGRDGRPVEGDARQNYPLHGVAVADGGPDGSGNVARRRRWPEDVRARVDSRAAARSAWEADAAA
jgi:hypothetical protein